MPPPQPFPPAGACEHRGKTRSGACRRVGSNGLNANVPIVNTHIISKNTDLVTGYCEEVDTKLLDVHWNLANGLRGICVQEDLCRS